MTLSIGPAIDNLVAKAQQAVAGLTVAGQPVQVVDGEPTVVSLAMFAVGLNRPPPEADAETAGERDLSPFGARFIDEDFFIPCFIDVRLPGKVTQKAVRDAAEAIFNAFAPLVSADQHLGGLLVGGGFAQIAAVTSTPSNVGTVAEPGRRQLITFGVHVTNVTY